MTQNVEQLLAEAMRRQGLNPSAVIGTFNAGAGALQSPAGTVAPATAARAPSPAPVHPGDILDVIRTERVPSLWAQVPAGVPTIQARQLAEQARQAEISAQLEREALAERIRAAQTAEQINRAQLAETARSNRAREALSLLSSGGGGQGFGPPPTAGERTAEAAAAAFLALDGNFRQRLRPAPQGSPPFRTPTPAPGPRGTLDRLRQGVAEIERATTPAKAPLDHATETMRSALSNPAFRQDLMRNQVDVYSVLDAFTTTALGQSLPVFMQNLGAQQPRLRTWGTHTPTNEIDLVNADPLFLQLRALLAEQGVLELPSVVESPAPAPPQTPARQPDFDAWGMP